MGELCTSALAAVLSRSARVSLQLSTAWGRGNGGEGMGEREWGKLLPPSGSWGRARAAASKGSNSKSLRENSKNSLVIPGPSTFLLGSLGATPKEAQVFPSRELQRPWGKEVCEAEMMLK